MWSQQYILSTYLVDSSKKLFTKIILQLHSIKYCYVYLMCYGNTDAQKFGSLFKIFLIKISYTEMKFIVKSYFHGE